ncbi:MAG: pyridoxal-phosphate dependent enzyme [Candidatus Absconditabacterales bacterium]|nr:pyridoxal-phosphate dependent enzyme [Candidatus Absconditabacterales bacterium]
MKHQSITSVIGNTPLVALDLSKHGLGEYIVYAKCEFLNPFGSVKDRLVMGLIEPHIDDIKKHNKTIVESSSGNTAKAIAAYAGLHGLQSKTITNRINIPEQRAILTLLGIRVEELPGYGECPDLDDPDNPIAQVQKIVDLDPTQYFCPQQYTNSDNPGYHAKTTGQEIVNDLDRVDGFIGFLGTCGSSYGAGQTIKKHNPSAKIIGVVSHEGQVIPGGRTAIETRETSAFHMDFYDYIQTVSIDEALDANLALIRQHGLLVGPTTGGNFAALLTYLREHTPPAGSVFVFIACDRCEWYISYYRKYRPSWFGIETKEETFDHIADDDVQCSWDDAEKKILTNVYHVIDMRGNMAYKLGHHPKAINIPAEILDDLLRQGGWLPKDAKIIIICRVGTQSINVAKKLRTLGYEARSIKNGWRGRK